jgi:hypothetical protein
VAVGYTHVKEPSFDYQILVIAGEGLLAWRFDYSQVDLFAGIGASVGYGRQQLGGMDEGTRYGTIFSYTGVGGMELPFESGLALSLFCEVGSQVFRAEERLGQHLLARFSLGVGYRF